MEKIKKFLIEIGKIFLISVFFWGFYHIMWITSDGPYNPPGFIESYLTILSMTIIVFLFKNFLNKKTEKEIDDLLNHLDDLTSFNFFKKKDVK